MAKKKPAKGPYSRPYLSDKELQQEQRRRAQEATVPITAIEERERLGTAGAQAIGESFQDMLLRQARQNQAAMQAIQQASGGAGSAITTSGVTSAQQAGEAVPLIAAGQAAGLRADVLEKGREERRQREADYRKNLAYFGEDLRKAEAEKQAARIEAAAAEKAYGFKLKELEYKNAAADQRQSNWERDYALKVQRENRLAANDTGNINDLIPTIGNIAKEMSTRKGAGNWSGTLSYYDPIKDKTVSVDIENVSTPFDPKTVSEAKKQTFWKNYLVKNKGVLPENISGNVGRSNFTRGDVAANPVDVAKSLFEYLGGLGYSRQDAYSAILRTPWGGVNARAISAALGA